MIFYRFILIFILFSLPQRAFASPSEITSKLRSIVEKGGWNTGLSVMNIESGNEIASVKGEELFKPASVLKILTTYAALNTLGPQYTFSTEIYGKVDEKGFTPELIVKGGGDPNLTLEEIWKIGRAIKERGVKTIGKLKIDDSLFSSKSPSGIRAYEAGSAPLACSFNSILFRICPSSNGEKAKVTFDPWEADIKIKGSITTSGSGAAPTYSVDRTNEGKFIYQVSGGIPSDVECVFLYRNVSDPNAYCSEVITGIFSSLGIKTTSTEINGQGNTYPLIYKHESVPLSDIVSSLNHFSTNFIAEEIVYALGQESSERWNYESGLKKITSLSRTLGYENVVIRDGSGLSHDNRISPKLISEILVLATKNDKFGPEIESSLPIAGLSGTLKRREFGSLNGILRAKTGSLDGVSSLAGFLRGKSGARYAFTILQNGVPSKDRALKMEHEIVERIAELG